MLRTLLNIASGISIFLCLALSALWVRGAFRGDRLIIAGRGGSQLDLLSNQGRVGIGFGFSPLPHSHPITWESIEEIWFIHGDVLGFSYTKIPDWEGEDRIDTMFRFPNWAPILLAIIPIFLRRRLTTPPSLAISPGSIPCMRCGYDLRATDPNTRCPECGLAAHRSVIAHVRPDDCAPRWVVSIVVGTALLVVAYSFFAGIIAMSAYTFTTNALLDSPSWSGHDRQLASLSLIYGATFASILNAIACFLLSRDDRRGGLSTLAVLHRWSLCVLPLLPILSLAPTAWIMSQDAFVRSGLNDWVNVLAIPLIMLPAITFLRLRTLALRLSLSRLSKYMTIVSIGYGIAMVTLFLTATQWNTLSDTKTHFYLTIGIPWAIVGVLAIWAIALLFRATVYFFRSWRQATANWRTAEAPGRV